MAQPSLDVEPNFDDDPDYRPSRRALAHLLFQALARKVVLFEFRERVWQLIDLLAHDPDPTVSQDARNDDASQLGINSTRSVALHAAVAYGLWCGDHLASENDAPSFELMPELRTLLEEKLDLEREPARAVRATYGQYLPNLLYLDKKWVRGRRPEIFPHDPAHRSYWRAAWDAFIRYASFNASAIRLLHEEFRLAIDLLDERSEDQLDNPGERPSEYVLLMYVLDLDDPGDSIVDRFFAHAPASMRVRGISHIGLAMGRGEVAAEKRPHLRQLWQERLESLEDGDPELREYGWWFSSRYFLDAEGLSLLRRTLGKSGGAVDDVKDVLAAVDELGEAEPRECLAVLELAMRGTESYLLDYARESVRSVLEAVFRSDNEGVRSDARRLIHELGEMGFHGMQDLLAA